MAPSLNRKSTTRTVVLAAASIGIAPSTVLAHPCYTLHEQHCIEEAPGAKLHSCLSEKQAAQVEGSSDECDVWLKAHTECKEEVEDGVYELRRTLAWSLVKT